MVANKIVIRDYVSISTKGLLKSVGDKIKKETYFNIMIKCLATATVHNCEDIIICSRNEELSFYISCFDVECLFHGLQDLIFREHFVQSMRDVPYLIQL